jgi:hypothetical protein
MKFINIFLDYDTLIYNLINNTNDLYAFLKLNEHHLISIHIIAMKSRLIKYFIQYKLFKLNITYDMLFTSFKYFKFNFNNHDNWNEKNKIIEAYKRTNYNDSTIIYCDDNIDILSKFHNSFIPSKNIKTCSFKNINHMINVIKVS